MSTSVPTWLQCLIDQSAPLSGCTAVDAAEDVIRNGARESSSEERLVVVRRGNEEMSLDDSHWKCIDGLGREMDRFFVDGSRKLDMGSKKAVACSLHKFPWTVTSTKCACT